MRYVIFFWLLLGLVACSGKSDVDKALLNEAARYHTEATAIQEQVEPVIDQIDFVRYWPENQRWLPTLQLSRSTA